MKKVLNLFLICSILALSTTPVLAKNTASSSKSANIAKKPEEIQIVEPEKKKKVNKKRERKKNIENAKSHQESSKEAEGMYETKFPAINSKIEYTDMNGEVTLSN